MLGVSFQPGSDQFGQQNGNGRPSAGSGVQEAIKILSLRLPRVVGAQGMTPMPLLTSQGSGGNPRVDSVVNQVLSRFMPGQQPTAPAPQAGSGLSGPNFSGASTPSYQPPRSLPWQPPAGFTPRVVVENPMGQTPRWPGQSQLDSGGPPPSLIAPLPNLPGPDFRNVLEGWYRPSGGGSESPTDLSMF